MERSRRKMLKKTALLAMPTIMTFNVTDVHATVSGAPRQSGSKINSEEIQNTFNRFFEKWHDKEFEGHRKDEWQKNLHGWYSAYLKWSQHKSSKIWR
jgi:hypothetical protein